MADDMILKLAQRGGVLGTNFTGEFLEEPKTGESMRSKISKWLNIFNILWI